jgi:hypothetical protein
MMLSPPDALEEVGWMKFHPSGRYPLFADASDDGSLQIFHGSVTGDMLSKRRG